MPLNNLQAIIWDLDNTLYRFDGDFENLCTVAAAKAVIKSGINMSYEEAFSYCQKSYDEYGHSYYLVIKEHQIDQHQIHFDYHSFIDETVIKKSIELIELMDQAPYKHVLVTHASFEWASRSLSHLGLKKFFSDDMIIPAEAIDFSRKSESTKPFLEALKKLETDIDHTIVIEDLANNLKIPKEMGLSTALVHYGRPPNPKPDYIDYFCNNAIEFLELAMAS